MYIPEPTPDVLELVERHPRIAPLVDDLSHTGMLILERIAIPNTTRRIDVVRPADIDPLLDLNADDPEQNLPYWAEIWPSGIALASTLFHDPGLVNGKPVIELGSGVGITAAAAIAAGADLTATDYAPESLTMTRITCQVHARRQPETRQVNWRSPDADLFRESGDRWPVVLAADVLYEERDIEPVLAVFDRILAPGGSVLLAEPGRRPSRRAVERAREQGWHIDTTSIKANWPDPKDAGVVVNIHRMTRGEPGQTLTTGTPDRYKHDSTS